MLIPQKDGLIRQIKLLFTLLKIPAVAFPFLNIYAVLRRKIALSAFLTACIRRSLPSAPMHAFTSPVPGSGKSMLVDLASIIATGEIAAVISQGKTDEEFEKRLGACLLAGDPIIAIDNC